jgi:heptosyltransferase-1
MKVLVVKTSSLGDIIHTLPAITDAAKAIKGISFDWVVEENFAEIPVWHKSVDRVIPVAVRRWRKSFWQSLRSGELKKYYKTVRSTEYDLVVDAQCLAKSAILSLFSNGTRAGLDWGSAREPLASCFYNKEIKVEKGQHAVMRVRQLFAKALDYEFNASSCDYGINFNVQADDYLVFLHGTTWATKHWPEEYWFKLAALAKDNGFRVKIPWGNEIEKTRAEKIASFCDGEVLDKMSLTELAKIIAAAKACVAVDTGLAHLAAALSVPTVSVYGPTNPVLTSTYGTGQTHLASSFSCAPCLQKKCTYQGARLVEPPCFKEITPELVLSNIKNLSTANCYMLRF